jgi:hypothetical protein
VNPHDQVPPKIRHSNFEWSATWEATRSARTAAGAELWARTAVHPDQRMGGGCVPLVDAVESAAAGLDAVDPQAFQVKPSDRETTALDQSAADGPSTGGQEEPKETADLRTHQAGLSVEAPHPGEDRQLGREVTRLHGSRFGLAFREFGRRRVRLFAEHHRYSNHLDGDAGAPGEGANRVQQALDEIAEMLFRLLGLDSDNGSEFIN